jgi:hypothetical protein
MTKQTLAAGMCLSTVLTFAAPRRASAEPSAEAAKAQAGLRFSEGDPSGADSGAVDARGSGKELSQLIRENAALRRRKAEATLRLQKENDALRAEIKDIAVQTAPPAPAPALAPAAQPRAEEMGGSIGFVIVGGLAGAAGCFMGGAIGAGPGCLIGATALGIVGACKGEQAGIKAAKYFEAKK